MPLAATQIVTFSPDPDDRNSHEYLSQREVTKRLAALLGFAFGGEYEAQRRNGSATYFVPRHTLSIEEANDLGIHDEDDLFGGVVPHPFVATKAITHGIVSEHARAPRGWSHALSSSLHDAVLPGYSAFTETDAVNAGRLLLRLGCVRIKPAHHLGGLGQKVVTNESELDAAIAALDKQDLREHGVVLEQNLESPTTYSIGQLHVRDWHIAYFGTQHTTRNNHDEEVYGGTDLTIVRGDIDDLLALDVTPSIRRAIEQVLRYDEAVEAAFPNFYASRRNYDVVQGADEKGKLVSGVLEQSWRYGGASAAEVDGLNALIANPDLHMVQASTHELYSSDEQLPSNADVYFDGDDARAGRLVKYCVIEAHGR